MNIDLTARLESQRALYKQAIDAAAERQRKEMEEKDRILYETNGAKIAAAIEHIMDEIDRCAQLGLQYINITIYRPSGGFTPTQKKCWDIIMDTLEKYGYVIGGVAMAETCLKFLGLEQTLEHNLQCGETFRIRFI